MLKPATTNDFNQDICFKPNRRRCFKCRHFYNKIQNNIYQQKSKVLFCVFPSIFWTPGHYSWTVYSLLFGFLQFLSIIIRAIMTIMIAKIMKIIMRALLTLSLSAFMFSRIVLFWAVAEIKQKL